MSSGRNEDALEWYDQNMHCNYPLTSQYSSVVSTAGDPLPSSFLVDINLVIADIGLNDLKNRIFLSRVERGATSIVAYFSITRTGGSLEFAKTEPVPLDTRNTVNPEDRTFQLVPVAASAEEFEQLSRTSGEVVVGSCVDMQRVPSMTFEFNAAKVVSPRVVVTSSGLDHVTVRGSDGVDHVLYNDFTIEAGDGVDLSVETLNGVPTVTITRVDTEEESAQSQYSSVEEVVNAVIRELGNPIRAINGIAPGNGGNFTLEGGDCMDVGSVSGGLFLSNPCSKPCCDAGSTTDVQAALEQLEQARSRLETYYLTLTNNVNALQSRLSALIAAG